MLKQYQSCDITYVCIAVPMIKLLILARFVAFHFFKRSQSIFHALSSSLPRAFADVSNWCWLACRRGVGNGFIILACLQITQRWRIERQLNDVEEEDVDPVTLSMSCSRSRIVLSPEQSRSKSRYHDWVMMTPQLMMWRIADGGGWPMVRAACGSGHDVHQWCQWCPLDIVHNQCGADAII